MTTKVFISWSGHLSQQLGEAIRNWLPSALQFVRPYFSPEDIEKGAKWNSEIAEQLASTDIGIICLTKENTDKPWILFEAGALSKSMDRSRVCTLLFGIEPADVTGPLTSFQATKFAREDFKRLFSLINSIAADARLEPQTLDSVFDMWWPQLETKVREILNSTSGVTTSQKRSDRDILEEILDITRASSTKYSRSRLSERAIFEMVEVIDDLPLMLGRGREDIAVVIDRRLRGPLRTLCGEVGIPYDFARGRRRRRYIASTSTNPLAPKYIDPVVGAVEAAEKE